jgi:hypothetical protein
MYSAPAAATMARDRRIGMVLSLPWSLRGVLNPRASAALRFRGAATGEEDPVSANDSSEQDAALAGASGDDVSAGTSVSGVGGQAGRTENPDAGLQPVADRAAAVGGGRDVAETGQEPPATNDGTGQSEKPA